MDRDATIRWLAQILYGTAPLRDAACRGRDALFDDVTEATGTDRAERLSAALGLCRRCPARLACSTVIHPTIGGRGGVAVQGGKALIGPELTRPGRTVICHKSHSGIRVIIGTE